MSLFNRKLVLAADSSFYLTLVLESLHSSVAAAVWLESSSLENPCDNQ